ncbi:hypothetical protein QNI19_14420 [Cytophagaceae bacterium DM2B3-1]|uniref:Uncharacterized protein n=1 Tax=Xanthocytophaga flava TaxID=3048013 RepID=A0ABT7CMB4_9BACT|nr:hypothetical protein [Xanthocytophaga flavus]MDJ1469353.1 hypothetical protein [Xanthocytophaga flavus]MDJ1494135.1 hypothetical protein [Xanthocytophaga flavus]
MSKKQIIKLLPLIILVLTALILVITLITTNMVFQKEHIIGLVLLSIIIVIQYIKTQIGYQVTGILLFLGIFSVISFIPSVVYIQLGFLHIEPFNLTIACIYTFVHRHELPDWLMDLWYGSSVKK